MTNILAAANKAGIKSVVFMVGMENPEWLEEPDKFPEAEAKVNGLIATTQRAKNSLETRGITIPIKLVVSFGPWVQGEGWENVIPSNRHYVESVETFRDMIKGANFDFALMIPYWYTKITGKWEHVEGVEYYIVPGSTKGLEGGSESAFDRFSVLSQYPHSGGFSATRPGRAMANVYGTFVGQENNIPTQIGDFVDGSLIERTDTFKGAYLVFEREDDINKALETWANTTVEDKVPTTDTESIANLQQAKDDLAKAKTKLEQDRVKLEQDRANITKLQDMVEVLESEGLKGLLEQYGTLTLGEQTAVDWIVSQYAKENAKEPEISKEMTLGRFGEVTLEDLPNILREEFSVDDMLELLRGEASGLSKLEELVLEFERRKKAIPTPSPMPTPTPVASQIQTSEAQLPWGTSAQRLGTSKTQLPWYVSV